MAEIRWARLIRTGIGIVLALILIGALAGIVITGPVVVSAPKRLDLPVQVSAERLERDVRFLCTEFEPRDHAHPENLDRAARWIADQLREAGLAVELQEYRAGGTRYRNVIGRQAGLDSEAGAIVVGAHYDAVERSPGADDNASGVAALIELARSRPQLGVRATRYFVAFSTGESPYLETDEMGSFVFARELERREERVELMIALDTLGYYSLDAGTQRMPLPGLRWLYSGRGDFVAVVGDVRSGASIRRVKQQMRAARSIPVKSFRAPAGLAPVLRSDHASFRRLGMPGVLVTDTASYRNPYYRSPQDTPDTLDFSRLRNVVRALHAVLWDPEAGDPAP